MIQANVFVLDLNINVCDECFQTSLEDLTWLTSIRNDRTLKNDFVILYKTGLCSDAILKIRDECFPVYTHTSPFLVFRSPVFKKGFEEHANTESAAKGNDPKNDKE
ncbi:hypothetical protein TNIN_483891 [Trichonephila inaurata madagascariensis]|uniref:Uncharacterized protein n=1 Tax=Trichonephila inaurata madagascariensis TaxID=2747483 RepID=A0A8X6YDA2_9ARAC|nr:hypothetical protein TNIN_483891 [Trichonephila inaurata madagascariensis]